MARSIQQVGFEAAVIGFIVAIVAIIITLIMSRGSYPSRDTFGKMAIAAFLTGVVTHGLFEVAGWNAKFCQQF